MTNWLTGPLSRAKKRAVSPRFWLKSLRDLLIFATVLYAISSYLQRDMLTGTAFPINSPLIDGREVSFFYPRQQSSTDKATLVYFWGTWCPVCKVTSPMVNSVANTQNYRVISVAVASGSNADIGTFMQQHNYQFDVINQLAEDNLSQQWGATALPSIFIIDNKNQIRFMTSGATSRWGMSLRLWLAST
ncbi:protein disulfide oxidoreductase [Shewanella inventionis]|nr:protein disulfide oxidoreductase [Shewanella inventionis]MCL1159018.1 protein disulfide oxidoreductase [Shewanella inventionis]UAL42479.1 protein disulfide oxidoreductase [Shewanella inventionis]